MVTVLSRSVENIDHTGKVGPRPALTAHRTTARNDGTDTNTHEHVRTSGQFTWTRVGLASGRDRRERSVDWCGDGVGEHTLGHRHQI